MWFLESHTFFAYAKHTCMRWNMRREEGKVRRDKKGRRKECRNFSWDNISRASRLTCRVYLACPCCCHQRCCRYYLRCAHMIVANRCPGYCDTFSGQHFKPEFDQGSNRLQLAHHKVVVEFVNRGTCETMTMQVNFMRLEVAACSGWLLLGVWLNHLCKVWTSWASTHLLFVLLVDKPGRYQYQKQFWESEDNCVNA